MSRFLKVGQSWINVSQIVQVRELAQSPTSPPGSWPRCEVQFVYSDPNQPFLLYQGNDAQTILAYVKANEVQASTRGVIILTFTLYAEDRRARGAEVQVDPAHVATVIESERRRGGAAVPVALRALTTGREFVVEDGARDVLSWIGEARWAGEQ